MLNGYEYVLHTDSTEVNIPEFKTSFETAARQQNLIGRSIEFLMGEEKRLYGLLGKSNYIDFMNELRGIFANSPQDARALESFKKENIQKMIGVNSLFSGLQDGVTVHLVCKVPQDFQLDGHLLNFANANMELIVKGKLDITFTYSASNIKQVLNVIQGSKLHKTSDNETLVRQILRELLSSGDIGTFTIGAGKSQVDILQKWKEDPSKAFSYGKGTIDSAIKGNQQNFLTIKKAIEDVYSILRDMCIGGSDCLMKAFNKAWEDKIGNAWKTLGSNSPEVDEKILLSFGFFSKGENASKGVGGAFGEFGAAVLFNYVNIFLKEKYPAPIAEILGNVVQKGESEQPKSDIELFRAFGEPLGIQIKNYDLSSLSDSNGNAKMDSRLDFLDVAYHHRGAIIDTNVHPSGLDNNLNGELGGDNIGEAIVQCCFNASNGDPNQFIDTIENYLLAQTMNFTTNAAEKDVNRVGRTVAFYILDSQYLVPGSDMLKMLHPVTSPQEGGTPETARHEIDITSSFDSHTDAEFLAQTLPSANESDNLKPLFTDYWHGSPKTDTWVPTEKNRSTFDTLYNKSVSIRVFFEFNFMVNPQYYLYH